jgi:protein-disulfide isomerase
MRHTRRGYLAAAGTVGLLAGCLGGGSRGTDDCSVGDEPTVSELPRPTLGDDAASVTVAAFEDFSCPHCATFSLEVLPELRSTYVDAGVVRYEHYDFPIPVDERWSWQAASAARGVQDETDAETFFEYAHALFANQDRYSARVLTDLADDVGAPGCAIQADALNETYRPVVEADRRRGREADIGGTPAVFVDGRPVAPTEDAISAAVERAR